MSSLHNERLFSSHIKIEKKMSLFYEKKKRPKCQKALDLQTPPHMLFVTESTLPGGSLKKTVIWNWNNTIIFAQNSISIDLQKWYHHFQRLCFTLVRKFGCPIRSDDEIWPPSVHFSLFFTDFSPFIQFFLRIERFLRKMNPIFVKSRKNATKYAAESSEFFQTTKFSRFSMVSCLMENP